MSGQEDYLVVEVKVMVRLGPDSEASWPEERCASRAAEIHDELARRYGVSTDFDWWVTTQ